MSTLKNKIDFAGIVSVNHANPNGDPLSGNRPRVTYDGSGEMSDVSIKRKIRNRLMEMGQSIFVQSDDSKVDDYPSLRARAEGELGKDVWKDRDLAIKGSCNKWIDVRAFGQVFAYSAEKNEEGVSIGIRGPVSIHSAFSKSRLEASSLQITKSVNNEDNKKDINKKTPDTMGMKHRVDHGVYVFCGAINPQLASKTWFKDEDAKAIKNALEHLFDNDVSSARPEGSMEVVAVFWWQHSVKHGQYSSAVVHRSLSVAPKEGVADPKQIGDYSIKLKCLSGLTPEIFNPTNVVIDRV